MTLGEIGSKEAPRSSGGTSFANFFDWQAQSRSFASMTIFNGWKPALTGLGEAERLSAAFVTAGVFDVLRVQPELGRATRPDEDRPEAPPVVVVSHGFWKRRLGAERTALGRTITLNGHPFTVVGVLPAGFRPSPPEIDVEVWANNYPDPRDTRGSRYLRAMGRLKPGVTVDSVRAEMRAISARLEAAYPKEDGGLTAVVLPLRRALTADSRSALLLLLAASVLLLAIACANVGNLLVARGAARSSEFAVRAALGASHWRLVRQLLTESFVLTAAGAAAGLIGAPWAVQLLLSLAPESVRAAGVHANPRVLLFTLATSLAAALLAGLLPAARVSPGRLQAALKGAGRGAGAGLHVRLRNGLAVAQLALALTLLALAGLLAKSFQRVSRVDPGIEPANLWTLALNVSETRYPKERQPLFFDELARRAAALPGVSSAAVSSVLPFSGDWDRIAVDVEGRPQPRGVDKPEGDRYIVSPGYFASMGIALKAGRLLSDADGYDAPLSAVVDEVFARRLENDGPAIGTRIHLPARDGFATVVGIVGHVRHYGLDGASGGQIYMSHRQFPWRWMHLVVRGQPGAGPLAAPLRAAVASLDPDVPVFDVKTMDDYMAQRSATRRFSTLLALVFAAAAVSLAALGLFGLVAYVAQQRRPELAIRMALGAQPGSIGRLVLRQGLRLGLLGTLLGLAGAIAGGRLVAGMLFQVGPADPAVLTGVAALLLAITLLASWLPARPSVARRPDRGASKRIGGDVTPLWQDLRYALRSLRKSPGFASLAILTLGIGIGANTAIFSLVHAVLLRSLPFRDPSRVLSVMETWKGLRGDVSAGNFNDLRLANRSFERLAAVRYSSFNLSHGEEPQRVVGARVTEDFFGVFGVQPERGRVFVPEEDRPGAAHVVVLSHRLWTGRLASDPNVLGQSLLLDGEPYTVVGIMPAAFDYARDNEELWVPAALPAEVLANHDDHDLSVFGLRKPGVARTAVQQDAEEIMRGLRRRFPRDDVGRGFRVDDFRNVLVANYRERLWILFGAVGLVLLIACTNVSNMLLARSAGRSREMTIRAALGASRGRIARQVLTECLVLGLAGGALGVLVASIGVQALVSLAPSGVPRIEQAAVDGGALAFALSISIASSLIFGLLPLARTARGDLQTALRQGGRGSRQGGSRDRVRTALVAGQIAVALTLLVGAGLLIRTAIHLQRVPPGFRASGVLTASITLSRGAYADPLVTERTLEDIVRELERMPNVESAAVATQIPLGSGGNSNGLLAEAADLDIAKAIDARLHVVTPHYFRVMGIPILRGRGFGSQDAAGQSRSMIVSRRLAERLWPGQDPLGRRVSCCEGSLEDPRWKTIVGIAGDVRSRGVREEAYPEFYLPIGQAPAEAWDWIQHTVTLTARAANGRAELLAGAVRQAAKSAAPGVPLYDIRTMEERLHGSLSEEHFHTTLLVTLGGIGLLLAAIGIYGIIAYFVSQRTAEFGVRIALGATPRDILLVTARHSLLPIGSGLIAGVVSSLAAARLLSAALRGVGPGDPLTFAAVVAVLSAAAALATYLPARRAARVDPIVALRNE